MGTVFRLFVDCDISNIKGTPHAPRDAIGFFNNSFQISSSIDVAISASIADVEYKMRERGYTEEEIIKSSFEIESISNISEEEIDSALSKSFIYYNLEN